MFSRPQTDAVSPVSVSEFEDFARVSGDPTSAGVLAAATSGVIDYLGFDLEDRAWVLKDRIERRYERGLRIVPHHLRDIDLPYTALRSVESVTIDGEAVEHEVIDGFPAQVRLTEYCQGDLVVNYTAGSHVTQNIKQAILMLGAFLFEHRGECDVMEAIKRSGVEALLHKKRIVCL